MTSILKFITLLLAITIFSSAHTSRSQAGEISASANDDEKSSATATKKNAVIIPLHGVILPEKFGGQEEPFIAAINAAQDDAEIQWLIIDIDSPGGAVDSCDRIARALLNSRVPTAAVVRHQAVSGGAMVATACGQIYMTTGSRLGDIQPMQFSGTQLDERSAEKIEADVRAIMAVNARQNHYPQILLEAMVSRSFEVYEVKYADGEREFMTSEQFALRRAHDDKPLAGSPKIVSAKDKLLSVSPQEAVEYGLAKKILATADDIADELKIAPENVKTASVAKGSFDPRKIFAQMEVSRSLALLLAVFLFIGIAGTLVEIHTPGFGIPGACGLIGFACFFYLLASYDRAEWYEIAIFIIGVILLVIEIVVLPGFGVCGIAGVICLLLGLTFAWLPDLSGEYLHANWRAELTSALIVSLGVVVVAGLGFLWLIDRGAKLPFHSGALLTEHLPDYQTVMNGQNANKSASATVDENSFVNFSDVKPAVNKDDLPTVFSRGVALTDLRPAGKIIVENGRIFDALTRGDFIEKDRDVVICEIHDDHILVANAGSDESKS